MISVSAHFRVATRLRSRGAGVKPLQRQDVFAMFSSVSYAEASNMNRICWLG
jgi:hypothetical protein